MESRREGEKKEERKERRKKGKKKGEVRKMEGKREDESGLGSRFQKKKWEFDSDSVFRSRS